MNNYCNDGLNYIKIIGSFYVLFSTYVMVLLYTPSTVRQSGQTCLTSLHMFKQNGIKKQHLNVETKRNSTLINNQK